MNWTDIISSCVGIILTMFVGVFIPRLSNALQKSAEMSQNNKMMALVATFVMAAEQMFRAQDPDGSIRNKYVKEQLELLGIEVDILINAMIEEAVYLLNSSNKK